MIFRFFSVLQYLTYKEPLRKHNNNETRFLCCWMYFLIFNKCYMLSRFLFGFFSSGSGWKISIQYIAMYWETYCVYLISYIENSKKEQYNFFKHKIKNCNFEGQIFFFCIKRIFPFNYYFIESTGVSVYFYIKIKNICAIVIFNYLNFSDWWYKNLNRFI